MKKLKNFKRLNVGSKLKCSYHGGCGRIATRQVGQVRYCPDCFRVAYPKWKREQDKKALRKLRWKKYPLSMKSKRRTVTGRVMDLRKRATMSELQFKDKLTAMGYKFKFQRGFIKGGYYAIVDFFIPKLKLAIEVDGGYHDEPRQKKKDDYRDNWLRTVRGVEVLRLTNKQAEDISVIDLKKLIQVPPSRNHNTTKQ